MAKQSITRRLIISVLLTQVVLTIAVVSLSSYFTRRQLRRSFDAALHGRAMSVAALVRFSEDVPNTLEFDSSLVPPPLDREHPDLFEIMRSDGHVIAASKDFPADFPRDKEGQQAWWTAKYRHDRYRVIRLDNVPVLDSEGPKSSSTTTLTVLYASSTDEMRERVWTVVLLTCVSSLVLLAISTAVTVWAVRRGLAPLGQLAMSAGSVTAQSWRLEAPRQARETRELVQLTNAMDTMLATLHQAFTSQREFVANAAHELKTPIAVLKSTLQLLLQRPRTAEEYRGQVEAALGDVERLEALTHSMLRLARAEQVQATKRNGNLPTVDVTATCEQSAVRLHPVADSKAVRIQVQSEGGPSLHADPEDLELIWSNLLENAIRYSPQGAAVLVKVSSEDGHARIDIRDSGPGIPEADLENIFSRFHRADASRSRETGGYGLGLAIVKAMVEAYGGTITAQSGLGSGTTMSVVLPFRS